MRALILFLPAAIALAGDTAPLENAARQWASDSAEERDAGSRAVAQYLQRELAPVVAAMRSPDPEVRRRARAALESLLPPQPPEPQVPELQPQMAAVRLIVNQNGAQQIRFVLNAQGQMVLVQGDQGEAQQLQAKGITGMPVDDPILRDQLCLAEGRGFAVTAVEARTDAARLGIEVRDILISIDGHPVKQPAEVLKGLSARLPVIKLLRHGKLLTLGALEEEGAAGEGR